MPTHLLTLSYDGTGFHGWQQQPGVRTVEGALRSALRDVGEATPRITAAGRTDAGAHAHAQSAGVTLMRHWDDASLVDALNAVLPADVAVRGATRREDGFHARHDALHRTYRYAVVHGARRAPLLRRVAWLISSPLDVPRMRDAAAHLVGSHDFAAFGGAPAPGGTMVRRVDAVTVDAHRAGLPGDEQSPNLAVITVRANAFLRGMVRAFAGALVAVGRGRLSESALGEMLWSPHGRAPSLTVAPAHGLHQWAVAYPEAA